MGGQDYGSVRTAAFMGLKILTVLGQKGARQRSRSQAEEVLPSERAECVGMMLGLISDSMQGCRLLQEEDNGFCSS